ncbi:hypothetical protein AGMMS50293_27090 [Spirochaetia bacterium]|nr:hypothetical protein AGMMS50293_27090 [Spirochaetia bacterium]
MLSSVDGASRESMQYMVETLTSTGEPLTSESFAVTPINRQLLESVSVPGRAESVKITFETVDNDVNFEVWPRIDIRKFILSALLLLFLYVNISFLKKKLFIINARWLSTKDNHTGMYYLAKKMAKKYPYFAQVIAVPELHEFWKKGELYNKINTLILYYIKLIAGKDDTVFLMEYFFDGTLDQTYLSMKLHNRVKLVALAHLVPARVAQSFSGEDILRGTSCLDKLLVFGSALRNYYLQKGVSETKVISTYHYVDNNYYRIKQRDKKTDGPLTVIAMGNVERNFDQLFEIIRETPDIRYKIFRGMNVSLDERCANFPNVNLYKHVEEDDLRRLMHESDVSLNVMNDVVGSNVVSTSLSCGLAMVCSDVGSIRDYVDPESGILFTNTSEAIEGLWRLNNDRNFLHSLQLKSLQKSNEIDMEPWTRWLSEFLTKKEQ